jgi:hypothetical protein
MALPAGLGSGWIAKRMPQSTEASHSAETFDGRRKTPHRVFRIKRLVEPMLFIESTFEVSNKTPLKISTQLMQNLTKSNI